MILAKQIIKTNQILSVGWSLSVGKFEKNFERISSHHWSVMSDVPYKVRINRMNIAKWKTTLNLGTSACYENFPIKTHAHHFFMWKQFMCVDCYEGRLTFSNIILHKTAIRWMSVTSQAEMRKDECVPEVATPEWNLIIINHWREIL